jgi:hypothetical protein
MVIILVSAYIFFLGMEHLSFYTTFLGVLCVLVGMDASRDVYWIDFVMYYRMEHDG